jgi:mono/diheme cytochrome c family protein
LIAVPGLVRSQFKSIWEEFVTKLTVGGFAVLALAFALPAKSAELPGKAIFEQTCKKCHGPEGKGDRIADKFFKVTIPRLNSAYVQNKSDEEIKEVVTKGRRKMDPVKPGTPIATHSVKAEWVDDVIAYVRTLKKK